MQNNLKNCHLLIIGSGGHALVVADAALTAGQHGIFTFVETNQTWSELQIKEKKITQELSIPIIAESDIEQSLKFFPGCELILGLGQQFMHVRQKIALNFHEKSYPIGTVLHPAATISKSAVVGCGTVIMAGAVINPFSVIGQHAVINTGATVDHDCKIGDHSFIQPGAHLAGGVTVKKNSVIGMGANIKEGLTIGTGSIVGAGAFVNHNVPDHSVYAGVPAKKIRDNLTMSSNPQYKENP